MSVTWRVTFEGWLRSCRRARPGGSPAARLPRATAGAEAPADPADRAGGRRQISEADLHGYIDGGLDASRLLDVEAFLAAHPLIAERVETYRSQNIAVNAAFRAGEDALPPALAQLGARYARAVAASSVTGTALGVLGLIAILCVIAEAAHGAYG